jgi:predicted DNA-binding protein
MPKTESNKKKRFFAVRLQNDTYSRLESESLFHGVSIATIMRTAIAQYLNKDISGKDTE